MNYLRNLASNFAQEKQNLLPITNLYLSQFVEGEIERFILLIGLPNRLYCLCESGNLGILSPPSTHQPAVVGTVWRSVMVEQSAQTPVLHALFNFSKGKFGFKNLLLIL